MNVVNLISIIALTLLSTLTKTTFSENVTIPGIGTLIGSTAKTAWTNQTVYQFLAIPYALSPSGERRFQKPQSSVTGREQTYLVRDHGIQCPSHWDTPIDAEFSDDLDLEDCLHLSVYTKNFTTEKPVMVFIHGGGLEIGGSMVYGPDYLLEKDVVFVVIQYRLGVLGFLSLQTDEMPGNVGLLDVVEALRWINGYARYFGGDPNRITIFGQSAGGLLVSALVASPSVELDGLFHRAIIQSGSYFASWAYDERPIGTVREFNEFTQCSNLTNVTDIGRCLKRLPLTELLEAYRDLSFARFLELRSPFAVARLSESEIHPLSHSPINYLSGGHSRRNISVMVGVTKHDAAFVASVITEVLGMTIGLNDTSFNSYQLLNNITSYLGVSDVTGSLSGLFSKTLFTQDTMTQGDYFQMLNGIVDVANTITFKAPALVAAQAQAQFHPNRTFLYTFDYGGQYSLGDTSFMNGTHHSDDLIYLMPISPPLNEDDTKMAMTMVDLWTSFAADGIPRSENLTIWPPLTRFSGPYIRINRNVTIGGDFMDEYSIVSGTNSDK